ncbi:MAG: response regulator [Spirochaetia bacterium]|jgi:two-component sensor histidine kinase|nr:response regulator [Spirochaetia bacterium]
MNLKVLIVDDEENIRNSLIRSLRKWAIENLISLEEAGSAKEALEFLKREHKNTAVIISDNKMPELSVTDFLKKVASVYPKIMRIMITGHADISIMGDLISAGICAFIEKPWDEVILHSELSKALELYQLREFSEQQERIQEKLKNAQLEKFNKEKIILLQEVHHRVKNNMAIISSMISLQSNSIKDEQLKDLLLSSHNRIQSMAIVHENIYQNESLSEINIKSYISELIGYLIQSFDLLESQIMLDIDVPDIILELDLLIPLGLIINEIVSNSFKHAYRDSREFALSVILKQIDTKKMYMSISDNGPGFNAEDNAVKEGSIGLILIRCLVDQIDGSLEIITEGKTVYEIYFKN